MYSLPILHVSILSAASPVIGPSIPTNINYVFINTTGRSNSVIVQSGGTVPVIGVTL